MAYLSWFLHPLLFGIATTVVILVLYAREFRSGIILNLGDPGDFAGR